MSLAIDGAVAAGARPTWRESLKQLQVRIKAHNVVIMCAGIAFYGVLALVPTLVALVTVYGIVTDPAEIADQIVSLSERMDQSTAELIGTQLDEIVRSAKGSDGTLALIISIVLALFSASAAVQKLMLSVSMAYATLEGRKGWVVRGLAYLFTAGAIVGIALIVFLLGALPTLMDEVGLSGPTKVLLNILRFPILAGLFAGALTILYRYGPDRPHRTPWRNPGAVAGTVAFLLFAFLFSQYFRFAGSMPPSYGVLGAVAALIIFFQLCAIAVIIGAEVNATHEGEDLDPATRGSNLAARGSTTVAPPPPANLATALAVVGAILVLGRND